MKATMKDVAERAGVSKSTVSQYLNKRYSYMSDATKERIRQAIDDLGYYPNQIAKSLKQKNTHVVAFVCATLSSRFSLELIATIEKAFQAANYSVIIAATEDDPVKERELINSFLARQVDGLLVFPTKENHDFYQQLQRRHVPIVFIDRLVPNLAIPSVLLDNQQAGYQATQVLLERGHRNIGIVTFPLGDQITTRVERIRGYRQALADSQVPFAKENVISGTLDTVEANLTNLMQRQNAPTAVILTNDMLLERTLMWVKEHHITVPEQLSLVGIDDVAFAWLFNPEITTLAQPIKKIGSQAAQLLLNLLTNEAPVKPGATRYSPELRMRRSIKSL